MKKGEKTKAIILKAGRDLFWKFSFKDISVDNICKVAEVNKGTFYRYFESKIDLCLKIIDHNYEMLIQDVFEASFAETTDPFAKYEGIIRRIYDLQNGFFENEGRCRGCPFINLAMELANQDESVRNSLNKAFEGISNYFGEIYVQAERQGLAKIKCDRNEMARKMLYVFNGSVVSAKIEKNPDLILEAIPVTKVLLGVV